MILVDICSKDQQWLAVSFGFRYPLANSFHLETNYFTDSDKINCLFPVDSESFRAVLPYSCNYLQLHDKQHAAQGTA